MKFENAAKGIKKIFSAEILALIAMLATTVAAVALVLATGAADLNDLGLAAVAGILLAVFGIAAVVLFIISAILNIVGIVNASKDDEGFKTALIFTILGIVFAVLSAVFQNGNTTVYSICSTLQKISELCVTLYIIQGIINLAQKLHNNDMVRRGTNLFKVILAVYLIYLLVDILTIVLQATSIIAGTIAIALTVGGAVLSIIQYILYLILLAKAKKMLAE